MRRTILAVVVGAAVVTVTVRLFIEPVARAAAAKACAVVLPGSVSEYTFNTAADLAMDAGLALPGAVVAVLIARHRIPQPGRRDHCGYNLTGNTSGR